MPPWTILLCRSSDRQKSEELLHRKELASWGEIGLGKRIGHTREWWEKENLKHILFRDKEGLPLLPWMEKWLEKRNLTIEELRKKGPSS